MFALFPKLYVSLFFNRFSTNIKSNIIINLLICYVIIHYLNSEVSGRAFFRKMMWNDVKKSCEENTDRSLKFGVLVVELKRLNKIMAKLISILHRSTLFSIFPCFVDFINNVCVKCEDSSKSPHRIWIINSCRLLAKKFKNEKKCF